MPPDKAQILVAHNETVPNSTPGQAFQAGGRLNYVNHIANDGAVPILVSFDEPHPVSNPIEVKASESLNDFVVAGGFQTIYIRGDGGTPSIRVLAGYRTDLPDRTSEAESREGNLELLTEIRDGINSLSAASAPPAPTPTSEDTQVDVALGLDGEEETARAGFGAFLPVLLVGAVVLTILSGPSDA